MTQLLWSTLEVDPAQFAPQVAYSTEKQTAYTKDGLEAHENSKVSQKESKRRICNLRKRTVVIILSIILVIVVCAAVGIRVGVSKKNQTPSSTNTSSSAIISTTRTVATLLATDFSLLTTTPTGTPTLPTGIFQLPISAPFNVDDTCVTDVGQADTWSCTIQGNTVSQMQVTRQSGGAYYLSLGRGNSTLSTYVYGMQEPITNITSAGVIGTDLDSPSRGPAYLFQAIFEKVVIVPEASLSPANTKARRLPDPDILSKRQNTAVQVGEKPWFCHWNSTFLEVFIYPNLTAGQRTISTVGAITTLTPTSPDSIPIFQTSYPKDVQIEHTVINASVSPYCEQYEIRNDGSAAPVVSSSGAVVTISINITSARAASCTCKWLMT